MALMEQLQVLQNKAARIIVDLPPRTSATEARNKLGWKLLSRRRTEHRDIFMFNCPNNLFTHSFNVVLKREHHDRSTDNARKAFSNRNWGLWTSKNFASNEWNNLDKSLWELRSLDKFKKTIRNVTI